MKVIFLHLLEEVIIINILYPNLLPVKYVRLRNIHILLCISKEIKQLLQNWIMAQNTVWNQAQEGIPKEILLLW